MTDSIVLTGDLDASKEFIAEMRRLIEEHRHDLYERIQRIRQRAMADEIAAKDRAHAEIEPLRRQMEAVIRAVAEYESLKASMPVIIATPH